MNTETEPIFMLNALGTPQAVVHHKFEIPVVPPAPPHPVNLENVCDFSNVCRLCAAITDFIIPVFSGEGLQVSLADKINKHLPIHVSEEDALPRVVCYQCSGTLLAWHELVTCCQQADDALRTRLAQLQPDTQVQTHAPKEVTAPPPNQDQESQSLEIKKTNESSAVEVEMMVDQTPPPEYPRVPPKVTNGDSKETLRPNRDSPDTDIASSKSSPFELAFRGFSPTEVTEVEAPPNPTKIMKTCEYCSTELLTDLYKDHLINSHSELLFYCDECDTYVARKAFILHMSVHAEAYTDKPEVKEPKNSNDEKPQKPKTPQKKEKEKSSNEFSDHSDTEDFEPLPESVFEAIEDSQDSQPTLSSESQTTTDASKSNTTSSSDVSPPATVQKTKKHKTPRTCHICSKVYTASSSYFYHMKYHHNNAKEFDCKTCGLKLGTKATLTQHMLLHSDDFQFQCKQNNCQKKFRSKASLYIHEQSHNGIKTYRCTECDMSFRWRTHLRRHLKRHIADKNHVCPICNRGFTIRCDLLRHARTHNAGSHACSKCGAKFAQVRYLKAHVDKKHPDNGTNGNN